MATIRLNYQTMMHVNMMGDSFGGMFADTSVVSATSTKIQVQFATPPDSDITTLTGTGFVFSTSGGQITGISAGTITSLSEVYNGQTFWTASGAAISAVALFQAAVPGASINSQYDVLLGGNDILYGSNTTGIIDGRSGDVLRGWKGNDTIYGLNGNDRIYGDIGNDSLVGGSGNDTLIGGTGRDTLVGGLGADSFVFNTALNGITNVDHITAMSRVDDIIKLDDAVFVGIGAVGQLAAAAMWVGTAAHDATDRVILDTATGNLYFDRDGTGAAAQILFATIEAGRVFNQTDFMIV